MSSPVLHTVGRFHAERSIADEGDFILIWTSLHEGSCELDGDVMFCDVGEVDNLITLLERMKTEMAGKYSDMKPEKGDTDG